jgi:hypothetical protein
MRSKSAERVCRNLGCAFGLGLTVMVVVMARPSTDVAGLPATVRVTVPPSGEVAVTPPRSKSVLVADRLRPGGARAAGRFSVQNQTGKTIGLAFRAHASSTELDRSVRLRLSTRGRLLADTTLRAGRRAGRVLSVRSGAARRLVVQAWMPRDAAGAYEGREVDVSLVPVIAWRRG